MKEEQKQPLYLKAYIDILKEEKISLRDKLVLIRLIDMSTNFKEIYISQRDLAKELGEDHPMNISRSLTKLEKLGLISRTKRDKSKGQEQSDVIKINHQKIDEYFQSNIFGKTIDNSVSKGDNKNKPYEFVFKRPVPKDRPKEKDFS